MSFAFVTCKIKYLFGRLILVNVFIFYIVLCKKKETDVPDFLSKEVNSLGKHTSCPLAQLTSSSVRSLWLKSQDSDEAVLCLLKYLGSEASGGDDVAWSLLGSSFQMKQLGRQADFCFKHAVKQLGKHSSFIKDWFFVGPFVVSKTEFDGDPLAAYGGIKNASVFRHNSKASVFSSELATDGMVKWRLLKQTTEQETLKISPKIDWNDLINSLGSMGITEWQGWLVGDLVVNDNNLQLSFQCLGVARCYVGETMIVGDLYHRSQFWFPVSLGRGVHSVFIPIKAKFAANIRFSLSKIDSFKILEPSFLPDLYDGCILSQSFLSVPVSNLRADRWLKISKVAIIAQSNGESLTSDLLSDKNIIAPGQVRPVIIQLKSGNGIKSSRINLCKDIELELKIFTSEGSENFKLRLRCRAKGSSFLFTFIDHDGSVQHAAAIEPLGTSGSDQSCPVFLTLHGTTVPPQNQADSYKRMVGGDFQFGVKGMWLLAPTRHGAHNWEGPGALTAMTALQALHDLTQISDWALIKADPSRVLFAGHSMGGHGAWHLASHFPDRAIGLISLASWITKEEYGDSNLFFRHDVATSHVDPAVKAIMEGCVRENSADVHVTNLKGVPVLARIGGSDRTVHPFFIRRMVRLLKEAKVNVTYTELPNLEHWWWDTKETNDGGCMNDGHIRKFIAQVLTMTEQSSACWAEDDNCRLGVNHWQELEQEPVTLVVVNPGFGEGLKGVIVLQQLVPFRTSKVQISSTGSSLVLETQNVQCLQIKKEVPNRGLDFQNIQRIVIDGTILDLGTREFPVTLCLAEETSEADSVWKYSTNLFDGGLQRGPHNYGPARRVAEREFVIVTGSAADPATRAMLLRHAVYIANQFYLTSDTWVPIVEDKDVDGSTRENFNLIILGSPQENLISSHYWSSLPDLHISHETGNIRLGHRCIYKGPRTGVVTLAPNGPDKLALLLMSLSSQGWEDVVRLATPTIPPMARSPFSNLLPDFVIIGPETELKGPGGFSCLGFWGNRWEFLASSSSCAC